MTRASPQPAHQPARPSRRRWLLAGSLAGVLVLAGAVAGFVWHRQSTPRPPAIDLAEFDPEAAAAVRDAETALEREPRSVAAWGHLGMVLFAHDVYRQA